MFFKPKSLNEIINGLQNLRFENKMIFMYVLKKYPNKFEEFLKCTLAFNDGHFKIHMIDVYGTIFELYYAKVFIEFLSDYQAHCLLFIIDTLDIDVYELIIIDAYPYKNKVSIKHRNYIPNTFVNLIRANPFQHIEDFNNPFIELRETFDKRNAHRITILPPT